MRHDLPARVPAPLVHLARFLVPVSSDDERHSRQRKYIRKRAESSPRTGQTIDRLSLDSLCKGKGWKGERAWVIS